MLHLRKRTKSPLPSLPFEKIKDFVLGQGYELSLVFVSKKISRELNQRYRGKDKPTNILSFPLSENEGEILIDIAIVREEAKELGENEREYLAYIFIHGLAHLKGLDHGSKMEVEEKKIRSKFKDIFVSSNFI